MALRGKKNHNELAEQFESKFNKSFKSKRKKTSVTDLKNVHRVARNLKKKSNQDLSGDFERTDSVEAFAKGTEVAGGDACDSAEAGLVSAASGVSDTDSSNTTIVGTKPQQATQTQHTTQKTQTKPSNVSLVKSSLVMFAGTGVSRALGLLRSALLLATLGAFGANDAFNIANTLPNTIFSLLAGGVLNAILVPQIVRAFRRKNGDEFVNQLLTTASAILLAITVISTACASLLVSLFAYNMSPGWKALAVAFAFWCLPQIFFYGLYVLYGQVLNAKYSFGPYMWTPVLNNIISIAGLGVFIYFFGFASPDTTEQLTFWTSEKISLIAGTGTLGIVAQALVLIPLINRTGFKLRIVWSIRTSEMKYTSKMALWAFGVVFLSQVELVLVSNLAASAQAYGVETHQFIPSITIHSFAYLIYIIPQSLVTTSVITALFTKLSDQAACGENEQMSKDYMFTSTILATLSIFASLSMMVLALPLATLVGPSRPAIEVIAIAKMLAIMCMCIPFQTFVTINIRVLFAYEKTKTAFFFEIPRVIFLIFSVFFVYYVFKPEHWLMAFCGASCLAFIMVTIIQSAYLKLNFPVISYSHLLGNYLKQYFIMIISASIGLYISNNLFSSIFSIEAPVERFFTAFGQIVFIGIIMLALYCTGIIFAKIPEVNSSLQLIKRKVFRR